MSGTSIQPDALAWVCALARSSTFAATVPLAGSGAVPRTLRAALALSLVPAVAARMTLSGLAVPGAFVLNACIGASFGLAAALIAWAASAAGSLFDAVLASNAISRDPLFHGSAGPFARLFGLAFGAAYLGSGALTHACERFAIASNAPALGPSVAGAIALVKTSFAGATTFAMPALVAQIAAAIIAGAVARAAPRVNGLMLASPLSGVILLLALLASGPAVAARIAAFARTAGAVP